MTESTTLKMMAVPRALREVPAMVNPSTKWAQSITIKPLITKENSPKVSKLIGKVNNFTIGLIIILMMPNTIATTKE